MIEFISFFVVIFLSVFFHEAGHYFAILSVQRLHFTKLSPSLKSNGLGFTMWYNNKFVTREQNQFIVVMGFLYMLPFTLLFLNDFILLGTYLVWCVITSSADFLIFFSSFFLEKGKLLRDNKDYDLRWWVV